MLSEDVGPAGVVKPKIFCDGGMRFLILIQWFLFAY